MDLIVVYLCDRKLSLIDIKQQRDKNPHFGVSFDNPNVFHIASAFGGVGHRSRDAQELGKIVSIAQLEGGLHIIEAHINETAYHEQM